MPNTYVADVKAGSSFAMQQIGAPGQEAIPGRTIHGLRDIEIKMTGCVKLVMIGVLIGE